MLAVGIVVLVSTLLTFLVAGQTTVLIYSKLFLGVFLIGGYLVTHRDSARKMFGNKSNALLLISSVTALVFIVALGALNFIAAKNPKEFDVTREGIYTLADQTVKTLKGLKEDITVYAFYRSDDQQFKAARDTLDRYKSFTDKLKVEFIDPVQHPEEVEKYQIREGGSRLILTAKGSHEARPKDTSEQELTNALVKVTSSTQKKIYFLTGHGELETTDTSEKGMSEAQNLLKNEGYEVGTFSFAGSGADLSAGAAVDLSAAAPKGAEPVVPADAEVVLVFGPKTPLTQPEADALGKFLDRGGRVIVGMEPRKETGLEKLALAWHVDVKNDLVVDRNPVTQMLGMPPTMALVQKYEEHAITKDFRQPIAFLTSRSVAVNDKGAGAISGVTAKVLALTGKTSWGETDFTSNRASFDPATDNAGPLGLVAVASKKATVADKLSEEGRLIVFGDSEFANNRYYTFQANGDFFTNSVNFLADEEGKISIRPKTRGATRILLTETQSDVIKFFSIDILPVAIFALGVAIRAARRRK